MGEIATEKPLLWDAGVDWVTLTAPGDDDHTRALGALMGDQLSRAEEYGEALKPQGWSGFQGLGTKHLFFGRKEWGVMARASSSMANQVAKEVLKHGIEARCTRLDFQTTVQARTAQPGFAAAQREAIKAAQTGQAPRKPRGITLYESANGGSGIAVGDRTSSRFGRIYDKTAEQLGKIAPNLWRYEVEFKDDQSRHFWKICQSAASLEALSISAVVSYFNTVGINESWMFDAEVMKLPSTYEQSDNERKMAWLESHVSSTIMTLADAGFEARLRAWFEACLKRDHTPDAPNARPDLPGEY